MLYLLGKVTGKADDEDIISALQISLFSGILHKHTLRVQARSFPRGGTVPFGPRLSVYMISEIPFGALVS